MVEFDSNGMVIAQRINQKITHEIDHDRLYKKPLTEKKKHKWGRKRIEIPDKIKKEVIKLYKQGLGTIKLSTYLLGEGIKITPNTVNIRLKEWNVNIRPAPKNFLNTKKPKK